MLKSLQEMGLERIWLVGEEFKRAATDCLTSLASCSSVRLFEDVEAVKLALREAPVADYTILIKGSNGTKLYQLPEFI